MRTLSTNRRLARALIASAQYTLIVFAAGFVLGVIRVVVLEPALGPAVAVATELPVILAICWIVCGRVLRRTRLNPAWPDRFAMGVAAFAILIGLEITLVAALAGETVADFLNELITPHGLLGLAGQLAFAAFPLIRHRAPNGVRPTNR